MRTSTVSPVLATPLAVLLLLGMAPASAQYKIVSPDGRVTYTDRPPADGSVKITEMGRRRGEAELPPPSTLPAELQRTATRFPVTLFTAANCLPCDNGRTLLRQRGVPYTERQIVSNDDVAALERTVGGRTVPALTVGGQALRGFSPGDWTSYLDAAGYPRESRLPAGWTPPPATPLVARAAIPAPAAGTTGPAAPPPDPTPAAPVEAETTPEGATGIRF